MSEHIFAKNFPKKSLGQNFLISSAPIKRMIGLASVTADDAVLEIGPGKGVLTRALLARDAKVIAIEKDDTLIPLLQETFKGEIASGQLTLIHADILEKNIEDIIENESYKLIANIPYYITGEIMRKFLEAEHQPQCMALLVQKEVADRVVAKDGKESILSMSVKAYGMPSYGGTVKRMLFRPIPNVDSAILFIDTISKKLFKERGVTEARFFEVMKAGFAHKRKRLKNNLKGVISDEKLESIGMRRAEELSLEEWFELAKA